MRAPTCLKRMGVYLYDWEQKSVVDCILNLAGFRCGFKRLSGTMDMAVIHHHRCTARRLGLKFPGDK